mmetsp:Transcript_1174/g.2006  ORF Transcript_1174/g.2006 Transcript_1174/m.2006 type:complete len:241 (+) Transcript_1174:148-870(+)|eukprot:CAMPEP_0197527430 /NCGR_PEP_ID=MMETSP1318-20131121/21622_1 /TAXON_ID=552666 /ORGANISM="Partenskyella glossopodia, Strain RCC365" /LENGTH=240 /DNA_ID=CAMNT_0043082069 /DNA_START=100 /DNA_END=822 /DNA_ORIENTATION=-
MPDTFAKSKRFPMARRRTKQLPALPLRARPDSDFKDLPFPSKRYIPCPTSHKRSSIKHYYEKRHFPPRYSEEKLAPIRKKPLSPRHPRKAEGVAQVKRNNRIEKYDMLAGHRKAKASYRQRSEARTLEQAMGRKKRVADRLSRRNGMEDRSLGDKSYSAVEYSDGYYKKGITPRAFGGLRPLKNSESLNLTTCSSSSMIPRLRRIKSYSQVISEQRVRNERQEVVDLPSIPCEGFDSDVE